MDKARKNDPGPSSKVSREGFPRSTPRRGPQTPGGGLGGGKPDPGDPGAYLTTRLLIRLPPPGL